MLFLRFFKLIFVFIVILNLSFASGKWIQLNEAELENFKNDLFKKECGSQISNLLFWNTKENFPSLGIGHFIWRLQKDNFRTERFRPFLTFLKKRKYQLPHWLENTPTCPWPNRESFYQAIDQSDPRILDLKNLIENTQNEQAEFIVYLTNEELDVIFSCASSKGRWALKELLKEKKGQLAILDYINFKGSGLNPNERYEGKGWGVLQVIELMGENPLKKNVTQSFALAAIQLLEERVEHSPMQRERPFLIGWIKRCQSYYVP